MATPAWFNEVEYLNAKLTQLMRSNPSGDTPIGPDGFPYTNISQVADAFKAAGLTALEHYNMYGSKEELNPSEVFNSQEYCLLKLRQLQTEGTDAEKAAWASSKWEDVRYSIHQAGMSMGEHYTNYGAAEGVPMSNSFDTNAYLTAKLAALIADPAVSATWTGRGIKDVAKAISDAGMDPYTHYITYGGAANEVQANLPFGVTNPVHPEQGGGSNLTVNSGVGNYGTAGNDIFTSHEMGANTFVDGAAGWDTLNLNGTTTLKGVTLKSVEEVRSLVDQSGIDLSKSTDVQKFWAVDSSADVTAALTQQIGFEGDVQAFSSGSAAATTVTFKGAEGKEDKATVVLSDADFGAGSLVVTTNGAADSVETLTLELAGKNYAGHATAGINVGGTSNLVITGEGLLQKNAAGGAVVLTGADKALASIDASGATGNLNLSVATGKLASEFAYTGSTGNDKLAVTDPSKAKALTIDLGAGDNSLSLEGGAHKNSTFAAGDSKEDTLTLRGFGEVTGNIGKAFTGFENLKLQGATTYTVGNIEGIATYEILAGAGASAIKNLSDDNTVTFSGVAGTGTSSLMIINKEITNAGTNLNLVFDNGSATAASGAATTLTTTFKELTIESAGNVDSTLADNSLILRGDKDGTVGNANNITTKVTIGGDQDFTFNASGATALAEIDGRKADGDLTISAATATHALTIYGGNGDDTISTSGSAANFVQGGKGQDLITLLTGTIDTIKVVAGDSQLGNHDVITGFETIAREDIFDLTGFGFAADTKAKVTTSSTLVGNITTETGAPNTSTAPSAAFNFNLSNASTFFSDNKGKVVVAELASVGALVLIDTNGNSAWDEGDDVIMLVGAYNTTGGSATTFGDANFIFTAV